MISILTLFRKAFSWIIIGGFFDMTAHATRIGIEFVWVCAALVEYLNVYHVLLTTSMCGWHTYRSGITFARLLRTNTYMLESIIVTYIKTRLLVGDSA